MPQASPGYLGVGVETTPGTAVAPTKFIPAESVNMEFPKDSQEIREIRGSRQAYTMLDGAVTPAVNLTSLVYPKTFFGVLMRALFGDVVTTTPGGATTARKHSFVDAATLPSLTFERSDTRSLGTGNLFERSGGHRIESVSFTAEFGQPVRFDLTTMGSGGPVTPGSKPLAATIDASLPSTDLIMNFNQASIEVDGAAFNDVKSVTFDFNNTLDPQNTLRGSLYPYKIYEGGMGCTLSADLAFETVTLYNKFVANTECSFRFKALGPVIEAAIQYEFNVFWPKLGIRNFSSEMTAGEVINASVEFDVKWDQATSKMVEMYIVNNESTANIYGT